MIMAHGFGAFPHPFRSEGHKRHQEEKGHPEIAAAHLYEELLDRVDPDRPDTWIDNDEALLLLRHGDAIARQLVADQIEYEHFVDPNNEVLRLITGDASLH